MNININFSKLNNCLLQMGASESFFPERIKLEKRSGHKIDLSIGVEVNGLSDIVVKNDLLTYNGEVVIAYIKDQGSKINLVLDGDIKSGKKYHVSWCRTLSEMKRKGKKDKYTLINSLSDEFEIFGEEYDVYNEGRSRLNVCKNCLDQLNYQGYKKLSQQDKNKIVNQFNKAEFFEQHTNNLQEYNSGYSIIGQSGYSTDWKSVSKRYRESKNYICEKCHVDLSEEKGLLHTHHVNGNKSDNRPINLKALCVQCHSNEPDHNHMKFDKDYDFECSLIESLKSYQ